MTHGLSLIEHNALLSVEVGAQLVKAPCVETSTCFSVVLTPLLVCIPMQSEGARNSNLLFNAIQLVYSRMTTKNRFP